MRMRKKKHAADRMNALASLFVGELGEGELIDCENMFGNCGGVSVEIGCGKGDFIKQLSLCEPQRNFIAVERVEDVIVVAAEKYASSRDLGALAPNGGWRRADGSVVPMGETWDIPMSERGNVRFWRADAALLADHLAPGSVEAIYANFSDPWTKSGYVNRRLTASGFLDAYVRLLVPGGTFSFKTDNEELFAFSVESVGASELEITFVTDDLHQSERAETNIVTEYEHNFSEQGIKIHMLEARKKPL